MAVSIAEYLGQRTDVDQQIVPVAKGTQIQCPFMDRTCDKASKVKNPTPPVCSVNRPGFPGECFICELRLPDHRFRWKHNKLFLLLPVGYGPAFPAIVDC
ncbi:TPA: hypothetical protein ACIAAO_005728, partial [Escherichia coli]